MRLLRVRPSLRLISPSFSASVGWAATTLTSAIASTRCAGIARSVRARRAAWRSAGLRSRGEGNGESRGGEEMICRSARCSRSRIPIASRRTAGQAARSCWPTAVAPTSIGSPRSRARPPPPFLPVAEITGTAAQGRIVLAAALTLAEIEAQFSDHIESRDEIAFDEASASLRARRLRRFGALALAEQPIAVVPDETTARMLAQGIVRLGIERLPWTTALRQWRDRVVFLRRTQGDEW